MSPDIARLLVDDRHRRLHGHAVSARPLRRRGAARPALHVRAAVLRQNVGFGMVEAGLRLAGRGADAALTATRPRQ